MTTLLWTILILSLLSYLVLSGILRYRPLSSSLWLLPQGIITALAADAFLWTIITPSGALQSDSVMPLFPGAVNGIGIGISADSTAMVLLFGILLAFLFESLTFFSLTLRQTSKERQHLDISVYLLIFAALMAVLASSLLNLLISQLILTLLVMRLDGKQQGSQGFALFLFDALFLIALFLCHTGANSISINFITKIVHSAEQLPSTYRIGNMLLIVTIFGKLTLLPVQRIFQTQLNPMTDWTVRLLPFNQAILQVAILIKLLPLFTKSAYLLILILGILLVIYSIMLSLTTTDYHSGTYRILLAMSGLIAMSPGILPRSHIITNMYGLIFSGIILTVIAALTEPGNGKNRQPTGSNSVLLFSTATGSKRKIRPDPLAWLYLLGAGLLIGCPLSLTFISKTKDYNFLLHLAALKPQYWLFLVAHGILLFLIILSLGRMLILHPLSNRPESDKAMAIHPKFYILFIIPLIGSLYIPYTFPKLNLFTPSIWFDQLEPLKTAIQPINFSQAYRGILIQLVILFLGGLSGWYIYHRKRNLTRQIEQHLQPLHDLLTGTKLTSLPAYTRFRKSLLNIQEWLLCSDIRTLKVSIPNLFTNFSQLTTQVARLHEKIYQKSVLKTDRQFAGSIRLFKNREHQYLVFGIALLAALTVFIIFLMI